MQSMRHRCSSTHLYPTGSQCLQEANLQSHRNGVPREQNTPQGTSWIRLYKFHLIHHTFFFNIFCRLRKLWLFCTSAAWAGALDCWPGVSWRTVRVMTLLFLLLVVVVVSKSNNVRVFHASLPHKVKFQSRDG